MEDVVRTERMATGGEAVGRLADGRVVFVAGAAPDETVRVELVADKRRFARARVVEVVEAGPDRVPLWCAHAERACGGCDWMHIERDAQRHWKLSIVHEQLQRLGGLDQPSARHHPDPPGRRTAARCLVIDGRAGYRGRRSSVGFAADECGATHPLLEELVVDGRFGAATEVVLRVAPNTGERVALLDGDQGDVRLPDDVVVGVAGGEPVSITERVAGRSWRITAGAFFQTSDRGAETLVAAVGDALAGSSGPIVDLYGGGGLLGGGTDEARRLDTVVEASPVACADAQHNLGDAVRVITARVERWRPDRAFGAVIADPARAGLGSEGVAVVDGTGADRLVLVSCDPASLGRDTGLLVASGWRHHDSTVVDMFPDTSQVEVVSRFDR